MVNNSGQVIDTDLIPANIKSGVNIFGVDGTYSGGGSEYDASVYKTLTLIGAGGETHISRVIHEIVGTFQNASSLYFITGLTCLEDENGGPILINIYKLDKTTLSITKYSQVFGMDENLSANGGNNGVEIQEDSGNLYIIYRYLDAGMTWHYSHIVFNTTTDTYLLPGGSGNCSGSNTYQLPTEGSITDISSGATSFDLGYNTNQSFPVLGNSESFDGYTRSVGYRGFSHYDQSLGISILFEILKA